MNNNIDWKKVMIYGSLAAGAVLLLTGRRPAGLILTGVGLAAFASENPERFEELWARLPEYVEKSSKVADLAATFLEKVAARSEGGGYRNIPVAGGNRY